MTKQQAQKDMSNAKADYAEKYNRYISMGYDSAEASHLALRAQEVKNPETLTEKFLNKARGIAKGVKVDGVSNTLIASG